MLLSQYAICSIDDVKLYLLDLVTSEKNDKLIAMLINGLSSTFEALTARKLLIQQYEEKFESPATVSFFTYRVKAPPIVPGSVEVRIDPTRNFTPDTIRTEGTDYVVDYNSGHIRLVSAFYWDLGWNTYAGYGANFYSVMNRPNTAFGFPRAAQSVKVKYVGGLVRPRQQPPPMPAISKVAGIKSGVFTYRFSVRLSPGEETAATYPPTVIELANEHVQFVFPDPGSGKSVVVYRSKQNSRELLLAALLPGGSGAITFVDNVSDDSLVYTDGPFSEGPLVVPDDIRLAAAQQIADWIVRGASVSTVATSGGPGDTRRYDTSQFTEFMKKTIVNYSIIRP